MTAVMTASIQGYCDPEFAAVREVFEANFRERGERGAAVAVAVPAAAAGSGGAGGVCMRRAFARQPCSLRRDCCKNEIAGLTGRRLFATFDPMSMGSGAMPCECNARYVRS